MLGGADLSAELGAAFDAHGLAWARGRLVNAAKAAGRQAWDVPHVDLGHEAALADETRAVIAMGFDCKTAIHPQQLATIHAAFRPTPAELDWAQSLLAAAPADSDGINVGAFLFNGRMVDAPLLKKARRIAERAAID
jgi:citrate lyase subunit beta/citryl-CoA lyase